MPRDAPVTSATFPLSLTEGPLLELLAPELLREDLFSALKALGDFRVWSRHHLVVGEAFHVAALEAVDDHPVEAGEVVGAPPEGEGMRLLEVARQRAREVHRVLLPRPRPCRFETECGRGVGRSHGGSSLREAADIAAPLNYFLVRRGGQGTRPGCASRLQLTDVLRALSAERKEEKLRRGWKEMPPWVFVTEAATPWTSTTSGAGSGRSSSPKLACVRFGFTTCGTPTLPS